MSVALEQTATWTTRDLTVVDLFCGAGGLSLGFQRAGFGLLRAIDDWRCAVETYTSNIGPHALQSPISRKLPLPSARVFVGGPPCQGFSSAGRRKDEDERNSLIAVFADLIAAYRPDAFVFENVEGFLTGARGRFVFELLERVIEAGYRVHLRKVNAANYGVPQHRKRVVAIGGLGWNPTFPAPTHLAFGAPGAKLVNDSYLIPTPTLEQALDGLPPAMPRGTPPILSDHDFLPLAGDVLTRAEILSPGQRMRDLPEELWHQSYRRRANRRVMDGTPTAKRGGAPAGIRRLKPNEPSKAITGGAVREFLHPIENRPFTIRECATLQTFPRDFLLHGSQPERIQLIGNAVPPLFAEAIARTLLRDLTVREREQHQQGALLSFLPTFSFGMSPVLQFVTNRVRARFWGREKRMKQGLLWR